jgi:hypothetical protein
VATTLRVHETIFHVPSKASPSVKIASSRVNDIADSDSRASIRKRRSIRHILQPLSIARWPLRHKAFMFAARL